MRRQLRRNPVLGDSFKSTGLYPALACCSSRLRPVVRQSACCCPVPMWRPSGVLAPQRSGPPVSDGGCWYASCATRSSDTVSAMTPR